MKWAILFLISIFICICCGQMLEWDSAGNLIAHSYSIWGDWSAHFTFISNLKERGLHWLAGDNPAFPGVPFQYPFLSHLLTVVAGFFIRADVIHSTLYVSIGLLLILPFVLARFLGKIGLTNRQSILGTILFLFLGGFQALDSNLNPNEPLTNQFKAGSIFTQPVLFELFPQRAFLFGIIFLLCGLTYAWTRQSTRGLSRLQFFALSIFFALLTWTHIHSWIALGTILLVYFAFSYISERKLPKRILQFGTLTALFSIPLLGFLLLRHSDVAGLDWQKRWPGWAQNPAADLPGAQEMNFFSFWIYNTGLFLPLVITGKYLLWKKHRKNVSDFLRSPLVVLAYSGSVLFIVAELINIQPYFYDNMKLFTYAFLFLTPLAAIALDSLFQKKILVPVALILLTLQSYTAIKDYFFFKDQRQSALFFSPEDFKLAKRFQELRRSPDSLVLIAPKHNHWVPALAGNPILMGYPGWLWSWGIAYQSREAEVNEILSGGPQALSALHFYPIEYIVVNDQDMAGSKGPVSISFLRANSTVLLEEGQWHVFQVKR